ncbi:MAG: TonB-dependent receptor [Marinilabiliaceae bacterium]|nr:TonB-dependent receptor [Marinilabiliaceae bacterium]
MKKNLFKRRISLILLLPWLIGSGLMAQNLVTGLVQEKNGEYLPGVSVVIKGTTNGTITNIDGEYQIEVTPEQTLVFSFIGMESQEFLVGDQLKIDVALVSDSESLDEVVVVGYGTQTRSQMTTAVSKLDTKLLESAPVANVASALQGSIAGLRVTNNTGQPGATPNIVLRGGTNFDGSGSPLVLIDGIEGSFFALNAEDIESMEVLKDAAATAIYGAKAADGVILITTKSGKKGKGTITYKYKHGINKRRDGNDYLNAEQFIRMNRLAVQDYTRVTGKTNFDNAFLHGTTSGFATGGNATDSKFTTQFLSDENRHLLNQPGWQTMLDPLDETKTILFMENQMNELFFQDSNVKDHYLSFDGGNDKGTYSLGLGYMDNAGLVFGSGFERISGKLNTSYKVKDNVKISSSILYANSDYSKAYLPDDWVFRRAAGQPPTSRIYNNNPDGTLSEELNPGTNIGFGNPLYYRDKAIKTNLEQRLTAGVTMEWNILPELKFTAKGSYFTVGKTDESFWKAYMNGGSLNTSREASVAHEREQKSQYTAMFDYRKTFFENHDVNILIGGEYFKHDEFWFSGATKNSPTDLIPTLNAGSEADGKPHSYYTENAIVSNFGRLVYDYKKKYLVNLSYRLDGSSKLGNEKWGFFPGLSAGWNLHNEEFFVNSGITPIVSKVKPRVSYGVNGNIKSLGNFQVFGSYGSQGIYAGQTGFANTSLPTLDLLWERSTTFDVGLDLGFFNNKVTVLADYFSRDVIDKISNITLPLWTGFSSIKSNNGILRNQGFELEINANVINKADLSWNLGATFYTVKNSVVELPDNGNDLNRQGGTQVYNPATGEVEWVGGLQEGKRIGTDEIWTYQQEFIYTTQAQLDADKDRVDMGLSGGTHPVTGAEYRKTRYLGDARWKDLNGDNIIDSNDRVFVGHTTPDIMGGFTSSLYYKGFNLFLKTDFAMGHVIRSEARVKGNAQTQGSLNSTTDVLNSWSEDNQNTNIPRYTFVDAQKNHYRNSLYWEKGDYLAIRELTLSYDFSAKLFEPVFNSKYLSNLRLYITGSNLAYLTEYSGWMPEAPKAKYKGVDYGTYPMPRIYTFGVEVTF